MENNKEDMLQKKALLKAILEKKKKNYVSRKSIEIMNREVGKNYFVASYEQKRLWLMYKLDPNSIAYNIHLGFRIYGNLKLDLLQEAINLMGIEQESLRTRFKNINYELMQVIEPNFDEKIKHIKISDISKENIEDELQRICKEESYKPFDLENGPLVRFILIEISPKEHVFMTVIHHIIFDGWSMGIFYRSLSEKYNKLCNGENSLIKKNVIKYADYASWQRRELSQKRMEKQFDYWKNKLEDIDQNVEFPVDKKRPQVATNNGDVVFFALDDNTVSSLKQYSALCECTVNTILLAVYKLLIYKYTNQNNITVGTAVANRKVDGIEDIIGFFVNTIVLTTEVDGSMKFSKLLKNVRNTTLEAYDNEDVPFDQLVERINPLRDSSRNPFFQLMFTYQNTKKSKLELKDLNVEEYELGSKRSSFDVTLQIEENEDGIFGSFEYNTDLFYRETIERICNQFKMAIKEILNDSSKKIDDILIISEEEKNLILNKFNDTYVKYDKEKTVVDVFEEQVQKNSNKIAIVYENKKLTYEELNKKVNILANKLRNLGIKPNDFIAISAERSLEMVIGILAIIKSGAAYVPIDHKYPQERINYILSDCKPKILLKYKSDINAKGVLTIDLDDENVFDGISKNLEKINKNNNLLYLIYTSGTTGKPKGVMVKHSNMVNYCLNDKRSALNGVFSRNLNNMGSVTNMIFDIFGTEILWVLLNGKTTFIANSDEQEDVEFLNSFITKNNIEILQTTPSRIKILLSKPEELKNLNSLKYIILCGEKLECDVVNKLHQYTNAVIENAYGPSETTILSTSKELSRDIVRNNISIGKPISNTQIYILKGLNLCGIGVPGELCIAGNGLAEGYLNNSKLTKEKFIDNPYKEGKLYRTGDLARWLPDGNIEYLGRIDEQVKIRGFRIELGEIVNVLNKISYIKDATVITREDLSGETAIYAYIVSDLDVDLKKVRKEIRKELPDYMIPSYMMQIEKIPVNRNGKLDKKALPYITNENTENYIAPRNEMEKIIVRIFEEIIGRDNIGIDADFFEIGGHSLKATKVANRIESETGIRIPIKIIFSERTAESIARYIKDYGAKKCTSIEKTEEKEYYPMSSVQRRIYLLWQIDQESTAYNMPTYYKLKGSIRVNDIKKSLQKIIDRHEILRTCFLMKDGELVQQILSKVEVDYSYEESKEEISKVIKSFIKPFCLEEGNLLRVKLVRIEEEYYMLLDMHHIVSDGMSMGIFIKEFSTLYNGGELSELSLQYKDYSEWMRKRNLNGQKKYWISQFEDEIPVIDLPYDYKRPAEQSYEGDTTSIELDREIKYGIKELCKTTGATEYMIFLSAFMVTLNKYTRQEDIVVGTPISGRTNKEMEAMMGMFVNTLAMRGRPESEKSFLKFLGEVKESCIKAYENQEYPFEELVEAVEVKRDISRNPLFDVMFGLQNNDKFNLLMNDVIIEQVWGELKVSKFDLSVMMESNELGYFIGAEYCTALFKRETINRFLFHFQEVILKVIDNPEILIGEIDIISEEEEDLILNNFNDTYAEYNKEKTVIDIFEEQVRKIPNDIAVVFENEQITYKELNNRANSLARILRKNGVGQDTIVGIMVDRSIEMIVGIISILKAGGAYLPIDLSYPSERIEFILENSECKVVLTKKELYKNISFKGKIIYLEEESLYKEDCSNLINLGNPDDLIYIIYTSGTTGTPKGVMFKKNSLTNLINFEINNTNIELRTRVLQFANICFDVASQEILSTLLAGGELYLIKDETRKDVVTLLKFIKEKEIKTVFLPTAYFKLLQSEKKYIEDIIKNVSHIVVAGEQLTLTEETKELIRISNINIHNHYGPSETHVVTASTINSFNNIKSIPSIGKPISNNKIYILDKMMNLSPINIQGEIYVCGEGVARGYLNNEKLTKEKFVDNSYEPGKKMYKTGDLARWLPDGNIEYLGRVDEQVKIRGFRIELSEILNVLCKIKYIRDAAVITRDDKNGEKSIYAYIVSDIDINLKEVKKEIRKELPDYMIPSYMMQIEKLPLNRNGKLDKRALPDIIQESMEEYIAPRNEIEEIIIKIFEDVVGRKNISIDSDFFEIGGHSLRATKVANRIEAEIGIKLPIKIIFSERTAEAIAKYIEKSEDKEYGFIPKAEEQEYYPMSSAQKRMYLIWQMDKESLAYNMPACYKLKGNVRIEDIKNSLQKMINRHEILRTCFVIENEELVQKSLEYLEADYSYEENMEEVYDIFERFTKPFSLDKGNLVRMRVVKSKEEYYLFIDMHHIVSDGMSMGIFMNEFSTFYNGGDLEELSLQYKDYSEWMRKRNLENQKAYWVGQFEEQAPVINLPYDYNRPLEQSFEGAITGINIQKEIKDGIKGLCRITGATEYMVLLSTFMVVLNKYTSQEDIVVGTPISGRTNKDMESMMGVFINTLAMRGRPEAEKSFLKFVDEVKESCLKAYENQEYPFEELVEEVEVRRDFARNPLFDVMFGLQNNDGFDLLMEDVTIETIWGEYRISKLDLSVNMESRDDGYYICAEYCTALFKEETINRLLIHFKEVLNNVINNPDILIGEVQIITKEEKDLILNKFNNTYVKLDKEETLVDMFEEQVKKTPNNIAVVYENKKLTYKELNKKANSLARVLRENGAESDKIVGIMLERSVEMIIAIIGVLKSGAAYLPIDPNYPKNRIDYMLKNSKTDILISMPELLTEIDFNRNVIDISKQEFFDKEINNLSKISKSKDLAYIIYTSGTTGTPKGVMVEHRSVINLVYALRDIVYSKYDSNLKVALVANYAFDASVQQIFASLLLGNTLYIVDDNSRMDGDELVRFYLNNQIDITDGTPIHLSMINNTTLLEDSNLKLKHMIIGGDKLLKDTVKNIYNKLKTNKVTITNVYGPTECTVDSTYQNVDINNINEFEDIPIGSLLDNYNGYILDKQNKMVPVGIVGELYISGEGLARGYLNNEKLTNEKFIDNPYKLGKKMYKTGDLVRWLPNGSIEYIGRIDEQVKIRGFRIELGEIANVLRKVKYIEDVAVITRDDKNGEKLIYAYLVSNLDIDLKEIRKEIRKELPDYMIPSYMMQIEEIPVNRNGKLDRNALPDVVAESKEEYIAPRNEIEKIIVKIFEDVVGRSKVSIDSDFFEIGGHSLRATKVANRIEAEIGVRIPIKIIFSERTVESIAKYIEKSKDEKSEFIPKAEEKEYYPMSSAQRRMYLIWEMDKESTAYNMPACYKLEGEVRASDIRSTLQKMIDRHEILRTCFVMKDGELVQNILDNVELDYFYEENVNGIHEILENFTKPFSLDKGNLIRIKVVKGKQEHYLLIDMHHIVSDGISSGIFIKEFSKLYNGETLKELTLQYKDYSEWMRSRNLENQKLYWISQFEDEVPIIDLPYDYKRSAEKSYEGAITSIVMEENIEKGIKRLCKLTGATEYMLLLSAFMVVLNKYTRQEDIVVGTPISGRTNKDMESMMGMFINTLAMRERPEAKKSFLKFVDEVKESCLKAYENQEYPFEELVETIDIARDLSRNPLFDVTFGLQNNEKFNLLMNDARICEIWGDHKISKFDLSIIMESREGKYFVVAEYCTSLFKEETINRFLLHFKEVLCRVLDNPEILIGEIQVITKEEEELILNKFNNTYLKYDKEKTVVDIFEEQVKSNPNSIAAVYENKKLTYKQLNEKANILGMKLREIGIKPDDFVTIAAEKSLEMIIGILGIIKAGGAYVPLDPKYPEERINYILSDCKPKALLTYKADIKLKDVPVIDLNDSKVFEGKLEKLEKINKANDLLYLIYTSGTTGKPKGVMIEHRGVNSLREYFINSLKVNSTDRILQFSNIAFDGSVWDMTMALLTGATLYIINQDKMLDINYVCEYAKEATVIAVPPQYYQQLKTNGQRLVVTAGSESSKDIVTKAIRNGSTYLNSYGPTEATVCATQWLCNKNDNVPERIPIGKPIDNKKIYICYKNKLCGIGMPGELCIAGEGLARGYLNRPELTEEKFINNPYGEGKLYKTGDLAKWLPDGNIEYLGRIDQQVKIRGFRIELEEIANTLRNIDDIKDVAVIVRDDISGEKSIYAYIVSDTNIDFKNVRKELRKELPDYMIPSYMMQIEEIPVNRNGKLDKKALPDIIQEVKSEYIAPRNDVEKIITKIFEDVIGISKISVDDDFFEIGGHSLRATKVVNRIEAEIGVRVPIKKIFSERTVESIAKYIEKSEIEEYDFIPKAKKKEYYPMSSAQKRMYLIWQMDKESLVYNMPICYKLEGKVREDDIKKSLQKMVDRHEILRTCFVMKNGDVVQKVLDNVKVDYSYEESLDDILKILKNFTKPFSLDEGNLVRMKVVKSKYEYYLLLDMHHIVSDGMSMGIFMNEFSAIYNGEELEELSLQYKDYSEWMRERNLDRQKAYWVSQFEDEIPVIDFPYDYKRPVEQCYEGSITNIKLNNRIKDGVKELCKITGATEYMVLLAAFIVTLNKYTRQEDIVVGTPISGRINKDMESMMGMFVNTLTIREKPEAGKSFIEFVDNVKKNCLKAYENQEYPFEELVEAIEVRRDFSRNPLFDITFGLQNNEKFNFIMDDVVINPISGDHRISKFDLSVIMESSEDGYYVHAEYCTALFNRETIKRFLVHFKEIICTVISNKESTIGEIAIITKEEENLILNKFNNTYVEYDKEKTVVDMFEEQVPKVANNIAVVYEKESLTYNELDEKANILGAKLRETGVKPNDFVAIVAERSLEMVIGILAIIKAGGAYVPIDPKYPEERIKYILSDCKPKALLTYKVDLDFEGIPIFDLYDKEVFEGKSKNLEKVNKPDDLLYLIYTSGTTGKPKGVMVKHSNIVNYCCKNEISTMSGVFKWDLNNMGSVTNICFDIFATEILFVFINGMTTFIANSDEQVDIKYLSSFIERNEIEILQTTPSRVRILLSDTETLKTLKSLKYILVGGEVLDSELVKKVYEYTNAVIRNGYGPSETTISSTSYEVPRNVVHNNIPIGKPIANTQVYILQGLKLCGINVPGELCIAGDGVTKGYLNKLELTEEKFINNPYGKGNLYRTGDLARWLPDGNIEYLGRIDEQIKIRGFRIELEEIANVLRKINCINDVAVITKNDSSGEKAIYGYVVSDTDLDLNNIRKEIRKELPDYMIPPYMMQIEEIPTTRNGKLDKNALPDIVVESEEEYIAPRNDVEKDLVDIWQTVLGVKTVGINDDFFKLGGDSIKSIQVIARAKEKGYYFEVKDLFANSNIMDLSKNIKHNILKISQNKVTGQVDLTPIQKWFFEMKFEENYHWNQSTMLFSENGFEKELIEKSFDAIVTHHDALRMIYRSENGQIKQINRDINEKLYDLNVYDYRYNKDIDEDKIQEMCNKIQCSINLEEGPLVKLGLFKTINGDHLLIIVHHLVVDGVSWRILFEDLQKAYVLAKNEQKIILQEKTTSFKEWAIKQKEYANSYNIKKKVEYWSNISSEKIERIPKDKSAEKSKFFNLRGVRTELAREETEKLLKHSNRAYNTEINDILLSALSLTINEWTGKEKTLINLESHGREEIIKDVDITRTIGWFTSQYPVVLKKSDNDLGMLIKTTKDLLRRIPNKGIDYGIIKYLSNDEIKDNIKFKLKPEISFNYLGQFDEDMNNEIFSASKLNSGVSIALNNKSLYSLNFSAILTDKKLKIDLIYCDNEYNEATIKLLINNYKANLIKIINHCSNKKISEKTASDITKENISLNELKPYLKDINNIKNIYPLTPMQEGMLYHSLIDDKSEAYHEALIIEIKGDLDVSILDKSFNRLICRHDILRTIFDNKNFDKNMQIVFNERNTNIVYKDISEEINKEAYINNIINEDKKIRFNLNKDILIRLKVIKVEKNVYKLVLSNHHIILDGWCSSTLIFELFKIYNGLKYGYDPNLKEVAPYSNYIEWLNNKNEEDAENYWKNYLTEYNEVIDIPFKDNCKKGEYKNSEVGFILEKDITSKLEKISKDSKVTVNTIIQSMWAILLQKYNNNDDIVFGYVVSGRNPEVKGIENMMGLFINTIPLRTKIKDSMSFKDLLININNSFIESSKYDFYPLSKIQQLSEVKDKLINNIMIFENYPIDDEGLNTELLVKNNLEIINVKGLEQTNYNFNLIVGYQDYISVKFQFNEFKYSRNSVEKIKNHFINLVNEVITNEDILVKDIKIIGEDERNKLLIEFNNTKVDYPRNKTIKELFEEQVEKAPNNIAAVFENKKITYKELDEKANVLGRRLRELGIKANDFVAISAERSLEMIIGILAIIKSGGAYVPIDSKYPEERINYILSDCRPKAILKYKANIKSEEIPLIDLSNKNLFEGKSENLKNINKSEDLLYLIYTSGTTGKPKGVMIKHRNMVNYCSNNEKSILASSFKSKFKNMACVTNISFDIFATETLLVFLNGMTTFIANSNEQEDVEYIYSFIEKNNIEILQTTPSRIKILLSQPEKLRNINSLKYIMIGGEKVEYDLVKELYEYTNAVVENVYGPSETTVWSTASELSRNIEQNNVSIGKPIANTQVYILQGLNLCGIGIPGELCIAGDGVAKGYLNNIELTTEKFIDNPYGDGKLYRTGDLARWLTDGNLEYLGRIDEQVKIRGFRIELGEIANVLRKIDYIKDAAVIAKENINGEKALHGYIVSDNNVDLKKIRKEIRKELPDYMIPAYMMQIEKIPVNRNGKLDKKELPNIHEESKQEYIAPRNEKEKIICNIFKKVLEVNKVGLQDNFFELGGDSIKLLRLISELRKEGFNVTFNIIKMSSTVKMLVENLGTISSNYENEKIKNENNISINRIIAPKEFKEDFINSNLYKKLYKYNRNTEDAINCKKYVPLKIQEDFLNRESPFISSLGVEIIGYISKDKILNFIKNIINSQAILRTIYNSKDNTLIEVSKNDWYIPYFDKDEYNAVYDYIGGIFQCEKLFETSELLSKIVIIEKDDNHHLVFFYVNHALWDFMTSEIILDMFKNMLVNSKKTFIPEETYYEYVNRKRNNSKEVEMYDSIENIEKNVEGYIRKISYNYDYAYKVMITKQINQFEKKEILENPIKWILEKYYKIINIKDIAQIPFTMVHHAREARTLNTLGLYADTIPCLYNVNKKEIKGWSKEEKMNDSSNDSHGLYKEKVPAESNIFKELSINITISESNYINFEKNTVNINERYEIGHMPEEIHMNIDKNMITVFCPVYEKKELKKKNIINNVKEIFDLV